MTPQPYEQRRKQARLNREHHEAQQDAFEKERRRQEELEEFARKTPAEKRDIIRRRQIAARRQHAKRTRKDEVRNRREADARSYKAGPGPEENKDLGGPPENKAGDRTRLPPGYEALHVAGGYYRLTAPGGQVIEGPSNRKWQGRDAAIDAAWRHYDAS